MATRRSTQKNEPAPAWDHTPEPELKIPHSIEAEKYVLGAIILEGSKAFEEVSPIIDATRFHLEAHRRIYAAMVGLYERGDPIDRVTLANEINNRGHMESVGGLTALVDLDKDIPSPPNPLHYALIVREKDNRRRLMVSAQAMLARAQDEAVPLTEVISAANGVFEKIQIGETEDEGKTPESIALNFPGGIEALLNPSSRKTGLGTGFTKLNEMLGGGLQNGELIILAARPGQGKSALMSNICQHVVLHPTEPKRVDIFSLEMSAPAMIIRMVCAGARVSQSKFRAGFLNYDERRQLQMALNALIESPLRIHDTFRKTLPGLLRMIKKAVKDGSRLIALDYAQLMVTGTKSENRNLEIGEIARALKLATLELDIPILLLSQIGRSADKRPGGGGRPQLSDLKDSGTLEESADTVLSIFREETIKRDRDDLKGLADLDILKQRNGECSSIPLRFIGSLIKFENRSEDVEPPEQQSTW